MYFFELGSVLLPRFDFKGNMRRWYVFVVHLFLFFRLLFVLSHNVHQRRSHGFCCCCYWYTFYFMGIPFIFWLCFLSLVPRKSEPNLWFTFCIRQDFQCTFLGLTLTLALFSFSILTAKSMDLESDRLDSNPNPNRSCSSLSLSFSSVTNEDCTNRLSRLRLID